MYEPDYIDRNDNAKHNEVIAEGHNVYSYNYDNGSTRVCRTNIKHEFKFDSTTVFNGSISMLSVKGSTWMVLTKDYPSQNRPNEWVKVTHTFTTDGLDSSEAEVCYGFSIPARNATGEKEIYAKGSTVTLGGFVFAAQQMETDSYAPTSNNVALGGFEPTNLSLKNGDTAAVYRCFGKRQPLFRLVQGRAAGNRGAGVNLCLGFFDRKSRLSSSL